MSSGAWWPDPTGRFQYRWWNGKAWTELTAEDGVQSSDPVTDSEARLPLDSPRPATPPIHNSIGPASPTISAKVGEFELASCSRRLAARLIDWTLVLILCSLYFLGWVLLYPNPDPSDSGERVQQIAMGFGFTVPLFAIAVIFLCEVLPIAKSGKSLGKKLLRIRVVQQGDGQAPSLGPSVGRCAIPYGLVIFPVLGAFASLLCYASITWDANRQGWHDKAAKTLVINS